jgi:hypothetical protein
MGYSSPYAWMISFANIRDENVRKLGDSYLSGHPDPSNHFYNIVEQEFIDMAAEKGVDLVLLNQVNPVHPFLQKWMVYQLQRRVAEALAGLNDVEIIYDKWAMKEKRYKQEVIDLQSKITYEMFLTASIQYNYTRSGAKSFKISC